MYKWLLGSLLVISPLAFDNSPHERTYQLIQQDSEGPFSYYLVPRGNLETFVSYHSSREDIIVIKKTGETLMYKPEESPPQDYSSMDESEYANDWQAVIKAKEDRLRSWILAVADTPGDMVMSNENLRRDFILVVCD